MVHHDPGANSLRRQGLFFRFCLLFLLFLFLPLFCLLLSFLDVGRPVLFILDPVFTIENCETPSGWEILWSFLVEILEHTS